jgi:hypothetical protein
MVSRGALAATLGVIVVVVIVTFTTVSVTKSRGGDGSVSLALSSSSMPTSFPSLQLVSTSVLPTQLDNGDATVDVIYNNSPTVPDSYSQRLYEYNLDVQIRNQWDTNLGYCGETSTIVAGQLLAGQYFSQYDVRLIYCSNLGIDVNNSDCQTQYQYLVGDGTYDMDTAMSLHMYAETYSADNSGDGDDGVTEAYLSWVKRHVRQGHVVTITVYDKDCTNEEYDHIVNVVGVESNFDDNEYHESDLLIYDDHYDDVYRVSFTDFPMTRDESANVDGAPQWSLPRGVANYGIAHIGPIGIGLKQVKLYTSVKEELPSIIEGQGTRPTDMLMTVYVVASGLDHGVEYNLYMYDDETLVPENDFNINSQDAVSADTFMADESGIYEFNFDARTSDKIIFRCVEA